MYNHYVPRFYLANFSGSSQYINKYIIKIGKIVPKASLRSTGGVDNLYGKKGDIEKALSQLEGEWAKLVREIIKSSCIPTDENSNELIRLFFIIGNARTLKKAQEEIEQFSVLYKSIAQMYKDHGKLDLSDETIASISAKMEIPNLYPLKQAYDLLPMINDLELRLIINKSSIDFVTTDNPVSMYNQLFIDRKYFRPYGYEHIGVQVFMPISPKHCLVLFDAKPYRLRLFYNGTFTTNDPLIIRRLNRLFVAYAFNEIYFGDNASDQSILLLADHRLRHPLSSSRKEIKGKDSHLIFLHNPSYWYGLGDNFFSSRKEFLNSAFPSHMEGPVRSMQP
ncbi:MAG: DUF4238 domain-containing protein [Christensenellales bacterium]|jgi:hypothetical protein